MQTSVSDFVNDSPIQKQDLRNARVQGKSLVPASVKIELVLFSLDWVSNWLGEGLISPTNGMGSVVCVDL